MRQVSEGLDAIGYAQAFEPYGSRLRASGELATKFGFAGQLVDDSGLMHLRARYYSPNQGGFVSRDAWQRTPESPMTYNPWLYVLGNPTNLTDPSGKTTEECFELPPGDLRSRCLREERLLRFYLGRGSAIAAPPGTIWSPATAVHLEAEIPQYTYGAQLTLGAPYGPNLCGQFALSMILETYTGLDIYDLIDRETNAKLGECTSETGEEIPCGWPSSTLTYTLGRLLKLVAPDWRFQVHWTSAAVDEDNNYFALSAVQDLRAAMRSGHFVIALTSLETSTGELVPGGGVGHWVVVTGLSRDWDNSSEASILNWVRVNNPHNNAVEYYRWADFNQSLLLANAFQAWRWLEVWPPPRSPREPPEL